MARPKREIDPKTFEGLCAIQCTETEICSVLKTDKRVVDRWCQRHYHKGFDEIYKTYADHGKMSVRRFQFKMAEKNPGMAIWLGKHWLGQRDDKILLPVETTNWPFMDKTKNPLNKHDTRNDKPVEQPLLETEQPLSYQRQKRAKDIIQA